MPTYKQNSHKIHKNTDNEKERCLPHQIITNEFSLSLAFSVIPAHNPRIYIKSDSPQFLETIKKKTMEPYLSKKRDPFFPDFPFSSAQKKVTEETTKTKDGNVGNERKT